MGDSSDGRLQHHTNARNSHYRVVRLPQLWRKIGAASAGEEVLEAAAGEDAVGELGEECVQGE
jgi:hypothetical protein